MSFDALIANPGRLRILTALAHEPRQEFVRLRGVTRMTDGNLTTHAKRLHLAGLLQIDKAFRDGKPVTTFTLTDQGRDALETHVERLVQALRPSDQPAEPVAPIHSFPNTSDDDWID